MSEASGGANEAVREYIAGLVAKARVAQKAIDNYTQEQVDELCTAIAWDIVKDGTAQEIARMAVEESGMGEYNSKYAKLLAKVKGGLRDMKGQKSVGVIERDEAKGIIKIAKPIGVIGAVMPITNCEATPPLKSISAIKCCNAIIHSPHPRVGKLNRHIVNIMRATLAKYGAPEDLIQTIDEPTIESSAELMRQVDLIVATGGGAMVGAAYSSGKPAYGVGQGNAMIVVDETADLADAANKVRRSKTFDYATSCSTENSLCIQESVYADMIKALEKEGGYLMNADEKAKLAKTLFRQHMVNPRIMAQSHEKIAAALGITLPAGKTFFMVEETGIGPDYPLSGEKLSVIVTLYKYKEFSQAIDMVNTITSYQGRGHSCGIHSMRDDRIMELALKTKVSRIMIRQPQCLANSGAWTNGMPMTMSLGCGTWGGNISSDNINWRKYMNVSWVSYPIPSTEPTDEELFGDIMRK